MLPPVRQHSLARAAGHIYGRHCSLRPVRGSVAPRSLSTAVAAADVIANHLGDMVARHDANRVRFDQSSICAGNQKDQTGL